MRLKKLWASLLVISLLFSFNGVSASENDNDYNAVEYWEEAIQNGDYSKVNDYEVTDQISTSNASEISEKRQSGNSGTDIIYQVVDNLDEASNNYFIFDEPTGGYYNTNPSPIPDYDEPTGGYYVTSTPTPTATPEPTATSTPTPTATPIPSEIVTVTPEPEATATPLPTATPEPTATPTPTSTPIPTATPTPSATPIPTSNPNPVTQVPVITVPKDESGIVYVVPEVKTPTKITYNVDLEVGRLAHFVPVQKTNDIKASSDTSVLNNPRSATGTFNVEYEARGNKPGDATITFVNNKESFTEEWNVHVFSRPLDFEKTEYVVEKPEGKDGYITLFLKYFEYEFEYAYSFEYSSSNTNVAYLAGGDSMSTYCRFCVRNPGVTIITVKDKFGNSSKCVLIVKDPNAKANSNTAKDTSKLSAKQLKKLVKASSIDLSATTKSGKIVLKWASDSEYDLELDGYQIQAKLATGKKYKLKKTITKGTKTTWNYTTGKNKKKYQFRVRGYKIINGKRVYTEWSYGETATFKK